jgi:dTDP-4-dehydrorhamnose 3,5-epimerase
MKIKKTFIDDLCLLSTPKFNDDRGYFYESYNKKVIDEFFKINFVQDNESKSKKGVVRGLHFQKPPFDQTKLVRCVFGNILDVAVDLRKNSKTYGNFFSVELSSKNNLQILIPKGFAHGFQVLSNEAIVNYKVDKFYSPDFESGIIWNDKDLSIKWNNHIEPILSKMDLELQFFKDFKSPF